MIYIILFLLSFLLIWFIKDYARKKAIIAQVNERSSHTVPTPQGGGIAIAITWFIGLFYLYFTSKINLKLFYALLFGIILSIVSFWDDIYDLNPQSRLFVQALVSLGGLYCLDGFNEVTFGIFDIQNPIFTNTFAFFMIIWFINLYNFLDGINGYAGSEAVFLAISGFILFGGNYFLVLIAAVMGFLYWNWNKAKIFMGDVGSTLLGYNVAIFTIYYSNLDPINLWRWIILFGVFWFDATVTLIRRMLNGEKLFQAHKKHAYQRLTQAGWSHLKVTICSIVLNLVLFTIVYLIPNIFLAFILALMILFLCMKFVDNKKKFE